MVSEILLHQTWAGKVVPVYEQVLAKYPTPHALANAKAGKLRTMLTPLGLLYRADTLKALGQSIENDFNGQVPTAAKALLSLPGIGPYTSSAIRCFAFGETTTIVDTNVVRLASRFFGIRYTSTRASVARDVGLVMEQALPRRSATRRFNYALLDFGAMLCTHYAPACTRCPLQRRCVASQDSWHLPQNSRDRQDLTARAVLATVDYGDI